MEESLNKRQLLFCLEYLKDFNATKAALRSGYSERSAGSIGAENLQKPEIRKEIARLSASHFAAQGLSVNRILSEVIAIAFCGDNSCNERLKALDILLKHKNSDSEVKHRDLEGTSKAILERLVKAKIRTK